MGKFKGLKSRIYFLFEFFARVWFFKDHVLLKGYLLVRNSHKELGSLKNKTQI